MRKLSVFLLIAGAGFAATAHAMKPGLWEVTSRMSGAGMPEMPKVPEAQRKQMEAMGIKLPSAPGGAVGMVMKHCVSKEQAERRQPPQSDEDRRQRCEQKDVKVSGNTVTWRIECSGEQKMTGTGSITHVSEESYNGESNFEMKDPKRGPVTMKQTYAGKWLGAACGK